MSTAENLDRPVFEESKLALQFAAEKQGMSLHAVDADWVAAVIARRVLLAASRSGSVVERARHDDEVQRLKRREDQLGKWWAGAKVSADQQLHRVQKALADMDDRALAEKLAEQIGVILPDVEDALFEVKP